MCMQGPGRARPGWAGMSLTVRIAVKRGPVALASDADSVLMLLLLLLLLFCCVRVCVSARAIHKSLHTQRVMPAAHVSTRNTQRNCVKRDGGVGGGGQGGCKATVWWKAKLISASTLAV